MIYGSAEGFHAVDLDSAEVYDIYLPKHVSAACHSDWTYPVNVKFNTQTQGAIIPHCIVALPNSNGMQLLLCYDNEGVYVNTAGRVSKNIVLQASIKIKISLSFLQHVAFLYKIVACPKN